jgi:peroxiredoxin (alkyl hydroperoxide reductase subunit C)
MKSLLIIAFLLTFNACLSQSLNRDSCPLISGTAPPFRAVTTMGTVNFPDDYFGKWKILFSHPADFTPVCTSEILALSLMQDEFKRLKTELLVLSTDNLNSHIEWIKSIESIAAEMGTPTKIEFPLIADPDLNVSRLYGLLQSGPVARDIRGVVIIDPDNQIRAFFHYPTSVGRNMDEIIRTIVALQTVDRHQIQTPANWKLGQEVLIPSPESIDAAKKLENRKNPKLRQVRWYYWYRTL